MAVSKKPSRAWKMKDLLCLGTKTGATYLKAVPVLILGNWVQGGRKEGRANFVRTRDLAERLERSGVGVGFDPKVTAHISGALTKVQRRRNLTDPPLIEFEAAGTHRLNLPHYEPLLEEYRRIYRDRYPEDYERLFPEEEPDWEGLGLPKKTVEHREGESAPAEWEIQDEIPDLLASLEQALRGREQVIKRLTEENKKSKAELISLRTFRTTIADEELRNDCEEFLKREDTYIDAVRRAGVVLEERIRRSIGGDGPERFKQGVGLVDYALTPNSGKLVISDHPAEQEGVRMLFRGALQFVRNPPSHKKIRYTETEARHAIGLIDYLLLLLQQVKTGEE
jgi:uncharacterized protein (TIGR02391 family)